MPKNEAGLASIVNSTCLPISYDLYFGDPLDHFTLRLRYSDLSTDGNKRQITGASGSKKKVKGDGFSIIFGCENGDSIRLTIKALEVGKYDFESRSSLEVVISKSIHASGNALGEAPKSSEILARQEIKNSVNFGRYENLLTIELEKSKLTYSLGNGNKVKSYSAQIGAQRIVSASLEVSPGNEMIIRELDIFTRESRSEDLGAHLDVWPAYDMSEFAEEPSDERLLRFPLEGRWKLYDFEIDSDLATLPTDYLFYLRAVEKPRPGSLAESDDAVATAVPAGQIEYDMVYLAGGQGNMKPGEIKARLKDSGFSGIWDVEWRATDGRILHSDIRMTLADFPLLSFTFPLHSARFRLRRPDTLK